MVFVCIKHSIDNREFVDLCVLNKYQASKDLENVIYVQLAYLWLVLVFIYSIWKYWSLIKFIFSVYSS